MRGNGVERVEAAPLAAAAATTGPSSSTFSSASAATSAAASAPVIVGFVVDSVVAVIAQPQVPHWTCSPVCSETSHCVGETVAVEVTFPAVLLLLLL